MAKENAQFYIHDQPTALSTFLPILQSHFPHSNPLYNRLRAPQNLPSRHCLFAATFPPPLQGESRSLTPEIYTILFADRSRHSESQIWLFNPLITLPLPLSVADQLTLHDHLQATIVLLKEIRIPEAPGWPFNSNLRMACLHELIAEPLMELARSEDALVRSTVWNLWVIQTTPPSSSESKSECPLKHRRPLPQGFTVVRVPEDQLDIVLSTSTIERQPSTLLTLPNIGLLNPEGRLTAWAYLGIDGSLATLYVLPEYRGKGLAAYAAKELLLRLGNAEFEDLGYDGKTGWVHSDVKKGNEESEGVMKSLGGSIGWQAMYVWVDSDKF